MRRVWRPRWTRSRGRSRTLPESAQGLGLNTECTEAEPQRKQRKMFSLKDKVAVVTGASQGIGRETALALAEAGAKVAVAARNDGKLTTLVEEIAAKSGEAFAVKLDVADAEQIKAVFKAVLERFGK